MKKKQIRQDNPFITGQPNLNKDFCGEINFQFFQKDDSGIRDDIEFFSNQPYIVTNFRNLRDDAEELPSKTKNSNIIEFLAKIWLFCQILAFYIPILQIIIPARVPSSPQPHNEEKSDSEKTTTLEPQGILSSAKAKQISLFEWHPTQPKFCYCFNLTSKKRRLVRIVTFALPNDPQSFRETKLLDIPSNEFIDGIYSDVGLEVDYGVHAISMKTLTFADEPLSPKTYKKREIDTLAIAENEKITIWNISTRTPKIQATLPLPFSFCNGNVSSLKWSKNSNVLCVSSYSDHRVLAFEFSENKTSNQKISNLYTRTETMAIRRNFLGTSNFDGPITSLKFANDGKLLVSTIGGQKLRIWSFDQKDFMNFKSKTVNLNDSQNKIVQILCDAFNLITKRTINSVLLKILPNGERIYVSENAPNPSALAWREDSASIIYSRFNDPAIDFLCFGKLNSKLIKKSVDLSELKISSNLGGNQSEESFCGRVKSFALDANGRRLVINFQDSPAFGVLQLTDQCEISKTLANSVADGLILIGSGDDAEIEEEMVLKQEKKVAFWSGEPNFKTRGSLLATIVGQKIHFTPFYYY